MKKVKAKEIAKGKWRIKPGDRLNLSSLENNKSVSEHLGKLAQVMEANIQILDKMKDHMDIRIEKMNEFEARLPTPSPITPNVEVIVPPPKEVKKKYRVTPVRDDDNRIMYVDIDQL
jgi:hypothetical protein